MIIIRIEIMKRIQAIIRVEAGIRTIRPIEVTKVAIMLTNMAMLVSNNKISKIETNIKKTL
jgi:hypothetical protein